MDHVTDAIIMPMVNVTFSDGQKVNASLITRVTLFSDDPRLLVEMKDSVVRVFGEGTEADAAMLNTVRDEHHLHYLVFESRKRPVDTSTNSQ
jgi:hypothetical protein